MKYYVCLETTDLYLSKKEWLKILGLSSSVLKCRDGIFRNGVCEFVFDKIGQCQIFEIETGRFLGGIEK